MDLGSGGWLGGFDLGRTIASEGRSKNGARCASEKQVLRFAQNDNQKGKGGWKDRLCSEEVEVREGWKDVDLGGEGAEEFDGA
jgi:hypothetical protein